MVLLMMQGCAVPAGALRRPVRRHRRPALRHRQDDQAPHHQVQLELPGRDRADGPRPALGPSDHRDARHRRRAKSAGPVGIEFRAVSDKMKIGRTMEAALQETADRLGTAEFQFFVITLAIQRETGGNLAETLSNLADVLRKRAQMKLKIRAMSSEFEGLGLHRRLAAVHRVRPRLHDQPRLHGRLLRRPAADRRRPWRPGAG